MLFSLSLFVISWISFFLFADKKQFFRFYPVCLLGIVFGLGTDVLTHYFPLWQYSGENKAQTFWRHVLDDLGVYVVVIYFFLQTLPRKQTFLMMARHIFLWSLLAIILEWIAVKTGNMKHGLWWSFGWSYLSDWVLFLLFYGHYKWIERQEMKRQNYT